MDWASSQAGIRLAAALGRLMPLPVGKALARRLADRARGLDRLDHRRALLGVNIGKSKVVPEDEAVRDYEKSESSYRAALRLDKDYFPAMNGLAVNLLNDYIRSNRTDNESLQEALSLLRRSLQLNKNQPKIVELLSRYGR